MKCQSRGAAAARVIAACLAGLLCAVPLSAAEAHGAARAPFVDHRDPPAYATLTSAEREHFDLGHALLNTQWVPAGTPRAGRRDGLGPLFNASSCDACHNEGARGQDIAGDGAAPAALVIQLAQPERSSGTGEDAPDPAYGHVLNTEAIAGFSAEADVQIRFRTRTGRYPDGSTWTLREPRYAFRKLSHGPLDPRSVIRPRMAPQLFGVGLLEQVPEAALIAAVKRGEGGLPPRSARAGNRLGRYGWQSATATIEEQTAVAMSREMGLTSALIGHDDCTEAEPACGAAPSGGVPEVSAEFMQALVEFQYFLAVPEADASVADASALFASTGCAACHRRSLPVEGVHGITAIDAGTDLLLHDLGSGLADRDAGGRVVSSRWRTAPLWGLAHAARRPLALLHDGRARSVEEAILWHDGEARTARERFERLDAGDRARLAAWVGSR